MSLHQDFGQLCNRGTRNSDFSLTPQWFCSVPLEKGEWHSPWTTRRGKPSLRKKGQPDVSALLPPHLYLPSLKLPCSQRGVWKHGEHDDDRLPKILAPGSAPTPWPQASNSHLCAFTPARKKGATINSEGCDVLEQEKSSIFERHLHPSYLCDARASPRTCHAGAVLIRVWSTSLRMERLAAPLAAFTEINCSHTLLVGS